MPEPEKTKLSPYWHFGSLFLVAVCCWLSPGHAAAQSKPEAQAKDVAQDKQEQSAIAK